jgi:hypothetical protein
LHHAHRAAAAGLRLRKCSRGGAEIVVDRLEPELAHLLLERVRVAGIHVLGEQPRVNHLVQQRFAQLFGLVAQVLR